MVELRRNTHGAWEEVVPPTCHNGHPLGVGRMRNSMGEHPQHGVRVRTWECNACGNVTFDEPEDWQLPRGQWGPSADYPVISVQQA